MLFCIFLYCRMHNYMYLYTNKAKNMTKITIKLMIPISRKIRGSIVVIDPFVMNLQCC